LAQAPTEKFPVHPTFLKALNCCHREITVKEDIYKIIYKIFQKKQSHFVLTTLIDSQLMGYTIPYLKKVINLPQFDGYHQFSVGIHSVKCIEALENIEDKRVKNLYENLTDDEKVFMKSVVLIHDAGKGRKKDHSEIGTVLFKGFAKKLGFTMEKIKLGKNLILYHTLMSITAQREDLHAEQVILKFSAHFQTQKELDYIYILTYADMNGVGRSMYNEFSARLINTLYKQSSLAISNVKLLQETSKRIKKEKQLQKREAFKLLPKTLQKKTLKITSDLFFINNSPERAIAILKQAHELKEHLYMITNDKFLTIEILRKGNLDLSYLLHKLARLDIVQMNIYKLFSGIKYFRIDFNELIDEDDYLELKELIDESLKEVHPLNVEQPKILAKDIFIDCDHSQDYAMLKLSCVNQKGLLSYIINLFDNLSIDICSAKIHTKVNRVNDLFLIEKDGNFCNNTNLIIKELTEN